jgi:tetratricopeptide (TPR) repeat protein
MPTSSRNLTFISYSHKNKVWLDKLLTILKPLMHKGEVIPWADTQIQPGTKWQPEIEKALASARVAVLLVSPDFLASDFIANHELPILLRKAKAGGLTVLWMHLSSSLYQATELEEYQAAHDISKPLDLMTEPEQAKVLAEIGQKIWAVSAAKKEGLESAIATDQSQEAIKGLRPFRREDAEIFARLGRQVEVDNCANAIADTDFRFGILSGESGCGKSSFMQAGLWPKLEGYRVPHQCVYVKFANEDPGETIERAMRDALKIQAPDLRDADLMGLFTAATQVVSKPIVLFFDQFEQFFVHQKYKQDRELFVRVLTHWYQQGTDLPIKIVVGIRGDFVDRLAELQKTMGYSIGPGQNFRLEKFEPEEAAGVVTVIANVEGLPIKEQFVRSMISELAGRDDGLISPAYLQIMCWVIKQQKTADKREFTSKAFQKLGGVEGLLERFLVDTLATQHSDTAKQAALKILLSLIDLDRNTRAGLITVATIQQKIQGTLAAKDVGNTADWLASSDVRLATSHEQNDEVAYELAHECLIPSIRKLAGKQLSEMDRANQLLDRRVNEWMGNDRKSSYLLTFEDWRLIERNRPYLIWGPQRALKETLLQHTKQQWKLRFRACLIGLFAVQMLVGLVLSPWGQIQQVKWDIAKLSKGHDQEVLRIIVRGLLPVGDLLQAGKAADRILNPGEKAKALGAVAQSAMQLGDMGKAAEWLKQAEAVAAQIEDAEEKTRALLTVVDATVQLGDMDKAAERLKQAVETAARIENSQLKAALLSRVVIHTAQSATTAKNAGWLKQAGAVATQIEDPVIKAQVLLTVANATVQLGDMGKAAEWLKQAGAVAAQFVDAWRKAQALFRAADATTQSANELEMVAQNDRAETNAWVQLRVVNATAQLATTAKNAEWLKQAGAVATQIEDAEKKTQALLTVANATVQLGDMDKAAEWLKQAEAAAAQIEGAREKVEALWRVARATAQLGDMDKAAELLKQAVEKAARIENSDVKAEVLRAVVHATADLGRWREAYSYATRNTTDTGRAMAFIVILHAWYRDGQAPQTQGENEFEE